MEMPQNEVQRKVLNEHIYKLHEHQQKVYEKLLDAVGEIQDRECQRKIKSGIMQSQFIIRLFQYLLVGIVPRSIL
jgi:hypothetical protein